jgi:hypothetical protein
MGCPTGIPLEDIIKRADSMRSELERVQPMELELKGLKQKVGELREKLISDEKRLVGYPAQPPNNALSYVLAKMQSLGLGADYD